MSCDGLGWTGGQGPLLVVQHVDSRAVCISKIRLQYPEMQVPAIAITSAR